VVTESAYFGEIARHRVDCAGTQLLIAELNPRHLGRRGEPVAVTADPEQVTVVER
jgi:hypothetical protein